jgi:hypothetical protein
VCSACVTEKAFGVTAAENKFERTGGLSAWARGTHTENNRL